MHDRLSIGDDGVTRCWWPGTDPLYVHYHDKEWGRPVLDDRALFGKLSLDAFQAGLSWITILRKREAFRSAFDGFDLETVAGYGPDDVQRLLADAGIVRHRGKIEATINNAQAVLSLVDEFGSFANYLRRFAPSIQAPPTYELLAATPESEALSSDLRARGFKFTGPTVVYAFMQAVGLVNDHLVGCAVRDEVERERTEARWPR